jgi:hypothetical protein
LWAKTTVEIVFKLIEAKLDPSGKEWSWWDVLTTMKHHPVVKKLVALLEAKSGISLSAASPEEWIERCIDRNAFKPKEQGGCGNNPYGPKP